MKLKIISGIMLITLSSLCTGQTVAASASSTVSAAALTTADGSGQQTTAAGWHKANNNDAKSARSAAQRPVLQAAPKYPQPYAGQAAAQLKRRTEQAAAPVTQPPGSSAALPVATAPSVNSAAVPATAATPATAAALTLRLQENHLLSQEVSSWAKAQGMRPLWNSNRDYLIYSTINLIGKDRDDVLNQLGQLFRSENYGLVVKLYEKNHVLVIDNQ